MLNRIYPLVLAVLLFLALFNTTENLGLLIWSLLGVIVLTTAVNLKRIGIYWPHLFLPIGLLVGVGMVYAVIANPSLRLIFLFAATVGFYTLERQLGRESHWLQNLFIISGLLIYIGLFAWNFYFVGLGFWWALGLISLASWLLIVQGFAGITLEAKKYFFILMMVIITQAAAGLLLWPTHFLLGATVLFLIFYLLWALALAVFFGKLSVQKIYWQLTMATAVLIAILSTASWLPIR